MVNPEILEETPLCLIDVKVAMSKIEKRDTELGLLSQKTKEYLDAFVERSQKDGKTLRKGIDSLGITRLKEEHICKIIDFLPQTADDLRYVLQGYNITLPKKDSEAIISEVKKVA
ncbi:hypothetical protein HOA92_00365 [archaeon]|jgi:DNA-directed RNA polymerase subunit F|nr:hypothetical protein [archaeon]MBT6761471.1 hypothetical protein [archaeon]